MTCAVKGRRRLARPRDRSCRERPPWRSGALRASGTVTIPGAPCAPERHGGRSLQAPAAAPSRRWWRGLAIALLAAGLILCHGCHRGDHDDELIVWLMDR